MTETANDNDGDAPEFCKVFLPGEVPWVKVLEYDGDRMRGEIDNKLFFEYSEFEQSKFLKEEFDRTRPVKRLHHYKQGDVLWFVRDEYNCWTPEKPQ